MQHLGVKHVSWSNLRKKTIQDSMCWLSFGLLAFNKQLHKSKRRGTKSVHTSGVDANSVDTNSVGWN